MGPSLLGIHAETLKEMGQFKLLRGMELQVGVGLLSLPLLQPLSCPSMSVFPAMVSMVCLPRTSH